MSGIYLLEIGVEELPAAHIPEAQTRLTTLFTEELKGQSLPFDEIKTYATPRRLTVVVSGLPQEQPTIQKSVRGPKYDAGFEADGSPKKAAIGFAQKNGIDVKDLAKEKVGDVDYIVANITIQGKKTGELLGDIVPRVINHVSGERLMRWGNSEFKFSRPIRWIVSLLDKEVVPFSINNVEAGRQSVGHRILAPGAIEFENPSQYKEKLKAAFVLVDQAERRAIILEQVEKLSREAGGESKKLDSELLEEVVNITEWPYAVKGTFSEDYLALPDALLETIMVHHQRYFPVQKANGNSSPDSIKTNNLLPCFITVANNDREGARETIRQGNERVLRARLADGKFFYFDDQKKKLEDRVADLDQLTYQHGLGSYLAKRERLSELAEFLARTMELDGAMSKHLKRAVELAKLDLVTNLVGELPELQGYVGAWYASAESEPEEVVRAIASHYAPRHTDDDIPRDRVGMWAGFIDKIDHLTGLFALGKRPTGSSDPFALRRNAQGLVDILLDGLSDQVVDLELVVDFLLDKFEPMLEARKNNKKAFERGRVKEELTDFILQRLRSKLTSQGVNREILDCVLSKPQPLKEISTVQDRCKVLSHLLASEDGVELVRSGVRVANILKPDSCSTVDESLLSTDEEKNLWSSYQSEVLARIETKEHLMNPASFDEYRAMLDCLKPLTGKIDSFFEGVMVNDEDSRKRDLRHGILMNIDRHFKQIGEFKPLQPLLP
ncbi:glycine--tRNA ligase subunit beta [bacterium]|nr:glycine--tRNA ligase subunit beta [bacterium]